MYFIYYKTQKNILRHYTCESPKEMWEAIKKVLDKGYRVSEVDELSRGYNAIYTLHFNLQGEPYLRELR